MSVCPRSSPLTEKCMQKTIPFAGKMALEWSNSTRLSIEGRYLINGTQPEGSMWAMMPLPFQPCFPDLNRTDLSMRDARFNLRVTRKVCRGKAGQFNGDYIVGDSQSLCQSLTFYSAEGIPPTLVRSRVSIR